MSLGDWQTLRDAGRLELAWLREAGRDVRSVQLRLLQRILRENAGSGFGGEHGFAETQSLEDFRARVPIRDYCRHLPWIERIRAGERHALTAEVPVAWEETGGSSGGRKLIPYTPAGLAAFRRAVLAWMADLLDADPAIAEGHAYFAISPATRSARKSEGGLPVGLPSDAAYFGEDLLPAVAAVSVGGEALAGIADFSDWQRRTLCLLTAAEDLTLISVWSPTFLLTLLRALEDKPEPVLRTLRDGEGGMPPLPGRGRALENALRGGKLDAERLWPKLRLLSAWAAAGSARFAEELKGRFPHARFQPKGLLATEGVLTFPLLGPGGSVPALASSFLEFADNGGRLHLADEIEAGGKYEVVLTTPGGLYRYAIGDCVRCTGFFGDGGIRLPILAFLGRSAATLDLVGEKLEEGFIAACLADAMPGFSALVPAAHGLHYLLLLEGGAGAQAADAAERMLRRNPLYADARRIGQLGPLEVVTLEKPVETYGAWRMQQGHRLGDIKPPVFFPSFDAAAAIWPELARAGRPVLA